ncbi:hypothetical protein C3F09_01445 [candidate division GN15 bacterium]|uniref:Glycerophosphoryl diester phosphodiesterase membrane domain-containing protein n=1 Tax=candidate division GN15 bacterium TaxID=2072418 RepID=A0A855X4W5_9BACT|nr:MAG: hypothetical protein C3F09_01445 [candidate division GN15 bacterium]
MRALIGHGWRAFYSNRKLWLYLYLVKLGLALVVTIPVLITVQSALENTLYSTPLLKEWSLKVIGELIFQRPFVLGYAVVATVIFALLVVLIRQFLNGGIYRAYASGARVTAREFFVAAGTRFGVHLRITGLMTIAYLLLLGIGIWFGSFAGRIITSTAPESGGVAFGVWLGVIGLFLTPAIAFSDTIRAASVRAGDTTLRPLMMEAFAFYRSRWVQLIGTYLLLFVPFVLLWALVEKSALLVTGALASKAGVFVELLLFQICSLLRTGQSLLFTASVANSYQSPVTLRSERVSGEVSGD